MSTATAMDGGPGHRALISLAAAGLLLVACGDSPEPHELTTGNIESDESAPARLELGDTETVEDAPPPDLLGRDRRAQETALEVEAPVEIEFAPMDLMTSTRPGAVSLFIADGAVPWSDDTVQRWTSRFRVVSATGDPIEVRPTYIAPDYARAERFHRIDLAFESLQNEWYSVVGELDGIGANVAGAATADGNRFVARFRPDSHPMLTAVAVAPTGGRLELRFTEQVTLPTGARDIRIGGTSGDRDCALSSPDPASRIQLECAGLEPGDEFDVTLSDRAEGADGGPVYGPDDSTPAVAHWSPRSVEYVDETPVVRLVSTQFLLPRI